MIGVWVLVAWLLVEAWRYNANAQAAANRREARRLLAEVRRAHRNLSLLAALEAEAARHLGDRQRPVVTLSQTDFEALDALANGDDQAFAEAVKRTTKKDET